MTEMQPAGSNLTVAPVTIQNHSSLVVYAMIDGVPVLPWIIGKVVGNIGTTKNFVVELTEATSADDTVLTMLHVDAGAIGENEFLAEDGPVV